jgi:hypothetical protein
VAVGDLLPRVGHAGGGLDGLDGEVERALRTTMWVRVGVCTRALVDERKRTLTASLMPRARPSVQKALQTSAWAGCVGW